MHPDPEPELPIVDIPSITQSEDTPESLLIHLDRSDLSDHSLEQLRYLHAQEYIPIEVIKQNNGVEPRLQVDLAAEITSKIDHYHGLLSWRGYPKNQRLYEVCNLIFVFFMEKKGRDGTINVNQMYRQFSNFMAKRSVREIIDQELRNTYHNTPTAAIYSTLKFLRQWCEFNMPRYLGALDQIQRSVFEKYGRKAGEYTPFITSVKHLFMHPAVTVLEEYGMPYSLTQKVLSQFQLGEEVDEILANLPTVDPAQLELPSFESEMLRDTIENL